MRSRVTSYFVLLLAYCLLAARCAPAAAPAGSTTLEFWGGWTGPDAEVMKEIVQEWNAGHADAQVNLTLQPWSQTYDQFLVSASSHSAPDILAMHPPEMEQFSALGLLLPLDEVVAGTAIRAESYNPTVWAANHVGGQLYGVPLDQQMYGLYYNTDLAKAAGVTIPTAPMTAAQYLDVLRRLTADSRGRHPGEAGFDPGNIAHYGVNMFTNHHAFYQWWGLYNQFAGVTFFSADGKGCAWELGKAARAWQFLQDLVYVQQVAPQGQTDYTRDFLTGRTAMLVDGPWRRPQLVTAAQEQGFHWAVAPYPQIFEQPGVWASGHTLTLPALADPKKRDLAVQFLQWLVASPAWARSGQVPVYAGSDATPEFAAIPGGDVLLSMVPDQHMLPNTPRYNEIFATNAPTPMMILAQEIILNQAPVRPTVEDACRTITAVLEVP